MKPMKTLQVSCRRDRSRRPRSNSAEARESLRQCLFLASNVLAFFVCLHRTPVHHHILPAAERLSVAAIYPLCLGFGCIAFTLACVDLRVQVPTFYRELGVWICSERRICRVWNSGLWRRPASINGRSSQVWDLWSLCVEFDKMHVHGFFIGPLVRMYVYECGTHGTRHLVWNSFKTDSDTPRPHWLSTLMQRDFQSRCFRACMRLIWFTIVRFAC